MRDTSNASGKMHPTELAQVRTGQKARRGPVPNYRVAANANPLVREVFEQMEAQRASFRGLGKKAGTSDVTLHQWAGAKVDPQLGSFVAVVEALGGKIRIEWGATALPAPSGDDLQSKLSVGASPHVDPASQGGHSDPMPLRGTGHLSIPESDESEPSS
jgi:hypothetical protein